MSGNPLEGLPPLIPIQSAAELLRLSRSSAYRYAKQGDLPCKRVGKRVYVITAQLCSLFDGPEGEPRDG